MSTGTILQIAIPTGMTVSIALISWWARKHPNRSKDHPERIRPPKVVPAVGWLFVAVGLLMGLAALSIEDPEIGMVISSVAIFLGGLMFLWIYRKVYVAPRQYELAFRKIFGPEHVLPYSDIVDYRMQRMRGQPFLWVRFANGVKYSLNVNAFNVAPMMQAIDFHRATGRWPMPVNAVNLPLADAAARNDPWPG
ncbi:hypothetical protein [Arthrobacter caoxuetaonis]|uniref:PH domain-containing protein n=1 Tax=Arthrobacter caoxuetaonis TaxID=2886935 RepID=A0A9X1MEX7_9MICC|nr:hypothetical protein [Arthrobacter caoxuetaonis]MCC3298082.1 hypothetical protein [Arthrobacter caoxuetaonis]USQ57092.1 hypothetical protein NF551_15395 [Arthrobacter caoxuetaonis]